MLSNNIAIKEKEEKRIYHFPTDLSVKNIELHSDQLEMEVIKFVQKLGIRPNLNGYHLLIKALSCSGTLSSETKRSMVM